MNAMIDPQRLREGIKKAERDMIAVMVAREVPPGKTALVWIGRYTALARAQLELIQDLALLHVRASEEPLEIDISDYSDEWCLGFLHGQVNALATVRDLLAAGSAAVEAPDASRTEAETEER